MHGCSELINLECERNPRERKEIVKLVPCQLDNSASGQSCREMHLKYLSPAQNTIEIRYSASNVSHRLTLCQTVMLVGWYCIFLSALFYASTGPHIHCKFSWLAVSKPSKCSWRQFVLLMTRIFARKVLIRWNSSKILFSTHNPEKLKILELYLLLQNLCR